jgi:cysteine-rich repeat protein
VPRSIVAGDTSVPIQSSLGYEEFGFPFQVAALNLDRRYHTTCEHTAFCMLTETLPGETACVPASSPPPPPADACWGTDPVPALLPAADPLPLPTTLGFDGTSQVAVTTAAAQSALTMTSAQTLEAWIRPEGTGQDATFLAKEGEYQIGVKPNAGKSVLAWSLANASPGWFWTYTGFEPPAHLWTHVALTYNGSSVVIYANGVPIQITAASGAIGDVGPTQNELRIGGRQAVPAAFRGQMDDVRIWSRALSRSEVIAGLGGLPGAGNTAGLAAWWRFDEGYGDLIRDEGPNGIDLALSTLGPGLAPVRRGDPPEAGPGGALLFDGVDDFVAVSDPAPLAPLDMNTALTIEAWIYPRNPSSGTGGVIVNKEGEYALTRWGDGRITFSIANTSPGWVSVHGTYVAPAHAWTHVAFVYDAAAAQARLYIDGALHQTWAASGTIGDAVPTQNELRIGGRQAAPTSQPFRGVIDEVRIWNRARTTAEIAAEFDRVIVDPAQATGLVGYWRFDEAAGGVAFDLAADGHASLGNTGPQFAPERNLAPHLPGQTLIYPTCGDGSTDPGETCDDGGTAGGDGCSPACRQETLFRLYGTPQGGTVTLVVEGVSIEVTILPGQMLAEVMATIALAIQSHPVLAAMRIAASTEGDDLIIGGSYSGVVVADPGLTDCTNGPALPFVAGGASNTCPETTVALSTGAYASYQWHRDGVPVAGATAASYDATLSGDYGVEVRDALGCPAVSSNVAVQVWFCPESEVSPRGAIFPLRIEASPQSSTGYYVYFQSLEGAIGYNLYSGLLPGPVDHAGSPVNVCDLVVADLGTGELRAELLLPDGDAGYVLIGAFDGGSEGIAHRDSDGVPIDPSQATCPP